MEASTLPAPRLLRDREVARVLGISRSLVHKRNRMGQLPMPVRIGRVLRWDANELQHWLDAGLPERGRWEAMKKESRTHG
ncbi:MAG: hypothetical protein DPW14_10505 [Planctomycetes bacterium]|nr:hypothetical protein [Planctomycetota bacterium]